MEYAYYCQTHAAERKNKTVKIPQNTVIKKECLIDIDNDEFVHCFSYLQDIAINVYDDMIENYAEYGIIAEADLKCPINLVSCFGDVLYQISLIGELKNGALTVDIAKFKAGVKKHRYNLILNKLCDNGFVITNHNGKAFIKGAVNFDVSYPDMPGVVNTLKGFALLIAKYMADVKPSYYMYMHDFFGCFMYRFAEDETTRIYPEPHFMTIADGYSENGKKALFWLHSEADKYGFKTSSGFGTALGFMNGNKGFLSLIEDKEHKVVVRLFLENVINKHINMLYDMPEYLQKPFGNTTCVFCGGIGAPGHGNTPSADGSCKLRFTFSWNGETIHSCKRTFTFLDVKYEDLPLLLNLYKTEYNIN
jgi:hypothetical protein